MRRGLLAAVALLSVGCRVVIFVGDSITSQPGYVDMLAEALPDALVINAGCGSTTSWQWQIEGRPIGRSCARLFPPGLSLYEHFVAPFLPAERAYVLLGTNDAVAFAFDVPLLAAPIPPDSYGLYVGTLAERLLEDGADSVILLAPPDPLEVDADTLARLEAYRARLELLCLHVPGVFCGPDLSEVLTAPGDYVDNLHPSVIGHAKIAAAIFEGF